MHGLTEAIIVYTQLEIAVARERQLLGEKVTKQRADRLAALTRERDRAAAQLDAYVNKLVAT